MSAARFVSFVKANLVGKHVHSAFVADTGLPRIVFSDGSTVEVSCALPIAGGGLMPGFEVPVLTSAESVPMEGK